MLLTYVIPYPCYCVHVIIFPHLRSPKQKCAHTRFYPPNTTFSEDGEGVEFFDEQFF
jgi:hypothetical protein